MIQLQEHDLEYAVSLYIDGLLGPLERAALEVRFAEDAHARALLAQYTKLNDALKTALPMPAIDFAQLNSNIKRSLEAEETPIKHYAIGSFAWTGRLAIAASVLFAISVATYFVRNSSSTNPSVQPDARGAIAVISGPAAEVAKSPVIAEISVGPSPSVASGNWRTSEEVITRPTVVQIDQARPAGQDSDPSVY